MAQNSSSPKLPKIPFRLITVALIGVGVLSLFFGGTHIVDEGYNGVVTRLGRVSTTVEPGMGFKIPFVDSVTQIPVSVLAVNRNAAAVSQDLQEVTIAANLNYRVLPAQVSFIFTNFRNNRQGWEDAIIVPAVETSIKTISARYQASDIVENREVITAEIRALIDARLRDRGFAIDEFSLTNVSFSEGFTTAIENKVVAEQSVLTAQRNLERERINAQQRVAEAEADAQATRARADAEAYALSQQREVLSPALLELRRIEAERLKAENWRPETLIIGGESSTLLNLPARERGQ